MLFSFIQRYSRDIFVTIAVHQ